VLAAADQRARRVREPPAWPGPAVQAPPEPIPSRRLPSAYHHCGGSRRGRSGGSSG